MKSVFGIIGLLAALLLTAMDFYTSYVGAHAIIPIDKGILTYVPLVMASLILAFNATSAYIFITVRDLGYTEPSKVFILGLWGFFLLFDALSSWVGFMLPIADSHSLGIMETFWNLSPLQKLFSILIPTLMVTGPFLTTVFWEMCSDAREQISQMTTIE